MAGVTLQGIRVLRPMASLQSWESPAIRSCVTVDLRHRWVLVLAQQKQISQGHYFSDFWGIVGASGQASSGAAEGSEGALLV